MTADQAIRPHGSRRTVAEPAAKQGRRWLPVALVVLATIIGFLSVFALWSKRQLLETDTWVDTSTELLEDEVISDAVADYTVDELFANVDVPAELATRLPPAIKPLAVPIAGGLRQLADQAARRVLQRPRVQGLWEDVNRTAHENFIKVIDDEGEFVSTGGGVVTLDLRGVVGEVATQVGLPSDLADKLPEETAQLEVLDSGELDTAQGLVKLLRTLAYVLTALTLLLFGLAIYLARDRRRETLRAVGFAFVIIGALVLFAHAAAGNAVTSALAATPAAEPPVEATWEIGTSLLRETGQGLVIYGIVIVFAAWLAGPTGIATSIRNEIAPYYRRPAVSLGVLAALLLLIFWWNPVVATSRLVPSLILIALLALGIEMLRRQIVAEFPDRVTPRSSEGIAQGLAGRMREARERRVAAATPPVAASPDEQRVSQLERLAKLHESGTLTDEEFAAEKAKLLARP
jgi:hypothetical protein